MQTITANQLAGRATGALFFTGFGALWLVLALAAREQLSAGSLCAVLGGALTLAAASFLLKRRATAFPRVADDPALGRAFGWINAVQWAAIIGVAFVFGRLHWDAYTPAAVTVLVGLHLFPLARLFRYPLHHVTGALLTAWAVASILIAPAGELQSTTAFGTGVILWVSAAVGLGLGFKWLVMRSYPV